jgi:hypothetical protein
MQHNCLFLNYNYLMFQDNQAYYDHWLFTNIERKATLDIEIFQ